MTDVAESKISVYLLVFMFCVGVGVINSVQNWVKPHHPLFWLYVCDGLVSPLQGFLNRYVDLKYHISLSFSIIYGMNKQLRSKWFDILRCRTDSEDPQSPINRSTEKSGLLERNGSFKNGSFKNGSFKNGSYKSLK
jgi:hypothetical protein